MKIMIGSMKYRYSDKFIEKSYWHGVCDVNVTLCYVSVTLSKYILDVHPRSDTTELAEAVPIAKLHTNSV